MTFKTLMATLIMLSFIACTKEETPETVACNEEKYDTAFTVEAGETYCFEDDTELKIVSLNNEFCPCNIICGWQGQLSIDMEWTLASGEKLEYLYNTEFKVRTNDPLPEGLAISHVIGDVTFVEECTDAVPSPDVRTAIITISK